MNLRNLGLSSFSGILAKLTSVLLMIALVPMAKNSLPPEGFGMWMLFTSLLMVLQFADFGIGNGLVTIISSHTSDKGESELDRAISTAIVLLGSIGLIFFLMALAVSIGVDNWVSVFGVTAVPDSTIRTTLILFSLFLAASIPAAVGQKILWGFQQVHIANLWQIISSLVTFLLFIALVWLGGDLVWMVAVSVIGPFVVLSVCSFDQLMRRRKHLALKASAVSPQMASRLLRLGGGWTIYQTLFFMATSADGVFVTHFFGAEAMGTYGVLMRMMMGLSLALFFTVPLWPLFSNAVASYNRNLISKYFFLGLLVSITIGLSSGILLFIFAQPVARIWIGPDFMLPSLLILSFSIWTLVYNIWACISSLMANESTMKEMVLISSFGCLIAIGLKFPLAAHLGMAGVCWASVIGVGFSCIWGILILIRRYGLLFSILTTGSK